MESYDSDDSNLESEEAYDKTIRKAKLTTVSTLKALILDLEEMIESKKEKIHALRKLRIIEREEAKRCKFNAYSGFTRGRVFDEYGDVEELYTDDSGVSYFEGESSSDESSKDDNKEE